MISVFNKMPYQEVMEISLEVWEKSGEMKVKKVVALNKFKRDIFIQSLSQPNVGQISWHK